MKYNRTVSKTINDVVQNYYPYDVRYGDGRKGSNHRIKYVMYGDHPNKETAAFIEQSVRIDLLNAGIKVNSAKFFDSKCYYPRMTRMAFAIHLDKEDC